MAEEKQQLSDRDQFDKIESDFRASLSAKAELHAEWREADDLYQAKHWNTQRASWRPDPVVNYVAYIVDQKAPQITASRPTGIVMPTSADDEETAKLFTKVTDVIAERVDLEDKVAELVVAGLLLGTSYLKVYWDNTLTGGSEMRGNLWVGDVAVDTVDPTNIYPDPEAIDIQEARYIIYAVPKSLQWIEKKFGVKVEADSSAISQTDVYSRPQNGQSKNRAMFYEYWYKDKDGLHCIYAAGGQVLKRINNVYAHGRYPFVDFRPKKNRKSLWGISEVKNIRANQKLLNKLLEMPTTIALLTQNPIALVNPTSGIDPNKWTNEPGKIYPVKDINNAAKWMEPPRMQGEALQLISTMTEFIEKIGGIRDVLSGETPGQVTAASAIQLLQEQGSIPIKGITRALYQTIKDVYELMIEYVKEFYTETRFIRLEGENGQTEFMEFQGAKYAEIDLDIKVSGGASTPMSKAYISQLSSELFDKGLLLGSEYIDMQEGLPNKDRIVQRLRDQESQQQAMQQQQMAMQQAAPAQQMSGGQQGSEPSMNGPQQPAQGPSLDEIYQQAPDDMKHAIDLMREQGMQDEAIMDNLLQSMKR